MVRCIWLLMVVIAPQSQRFAWKGAAFQAPLKPVPLSRSTGRIISQHIVPSPRLWRSHSNTPSAGFFGTRQRNGIGNSAALAASNGVVATSSRLPTPIPTSDIVALAAVSKLKPVLVIIWTMLRALLKTIAPSRMELILFGRISAAAMIGMAIGYERRTSNRPAGVRTM